MTRILPTMLMICTVVAVPASNVLSDEEQIGARPDDGPRGLKRNWRSNGFAGSGGWFAVSPDGKDIATWDNRSLVLIDPQTGERVRRSQWQSETTYEPAGISFSSDGKMIFVALRNGAVAALESNNLDVVSTLAIEKGLSITSMAVVGAAQIAIACYENKPASSSVLVFVDLNAGREIKRLVTDGESWSITGSPDGSVIAGSNSARGQEGRIQLWDPDNGKVLRVIRVGVRADRRRSVSALAFSPDGETLAAGCKDGKTRLWSMKTGELIRVISWNSYIGDVAFSADSKRIAVANHFSYAGANFTRFRGNELSVWYWDANRRLAYHETLPTQSSFDRIAILPDGGIVVSDGMSIFRYGSD